MAEWEPRNSDNNGAVLLSWKKENNKELTPSSRVWEPLFMEAIMPMGDELITQWAKINSANRCCYWRFPGNATAANLLGTQCVRGSLVYDTSRGRNHALFVPVLQILVGSRGTGNQDVREYWLSNLTQSYCV